MKCNRPPPTRSGPTRSLGVDSAIGAELGNRCEAAGVRPRDLIPRGLRAMLERYSFEATAIGGDSS